MFVYISNSIFGQLEIIERDNFDVCFSIFLACSKQNSKYQTCYMVVR